jgi:hypothetical protein
VFGEPVQIKLRELEARFNYTMVTTVAEQEKLYSSKREVSRAAAARDMMRKMYVSSL